VRAPAAPGRRRAQARSPARARRARFRRPAPTFLAAASLACYTRTLFPEVALKVGIINVTGYAGVELARLLRGHPEAELACVTGRSSAGQRLADVFPHLAPCELTIEPELSPVDFAFSALPHASSAGAIVPVLGTGARVVDMSADFRLKDASSYQQWYGVTHPASHLLADAVYGLPELARDAIRGARLVANPGCYSTAAILALAPAVKEGIIGPRVIADAKSGVSGAGRTLSLTSHYSEVNENFSAYGLGGHRHLPEMQQELTALDPALGLQLTFVPHLAPMTRGILCTCYGALADDRMGTGARGQAALLDLFRSFYAGEPFVRVVDRPPQTKQTWGNNVCLIHPTADWRTGTLIIVSCLDNLVKGAAGQAAQDMNIMCGFPETMGLEALAVYP